MKPNPLPLFLFLLHVLLLSIPSLSDVGVVVTYPSGEVHTECVHVPDGVSGERVLNLTSLSITWSEAGEFGRALCRIGSIGDPPSGSSCAWGNNYWAFYLSINGSKWSYSPVGFSGGGCWNRDFSSFAGHYCSNDGDVIGLAYGPYGTKPTFIEYQKICHSLLPSTIRSTIFNILMRFVGLAPLFNSMPLN